MLEQLCDVGGLDSGHVRSAGLRPVPPSRSTGKELGVLESRPPLDLETAPGKVDDPRRTGTGVHGSDPVSSLRLLLRLLLRSLFRRRRLRKLLRSRRAFVERLLQL